MGREASGEESGENEGRERAIRYPYQSQPVEVIHSPVSIQQVLVKDIPALGPAHPEIASGEEASHRMASEMVQPARLTELAHGSIDERIASATLLEDPRGAAEKRG